MADIQCAISQLSLLREPGSHVYQINRTRKGWDMKQLLKMFAILLVAGSAWAAVDINTATQSELEGVRGLGPAKAKAIIAYREKHGSFKTLDDLDNVKGFGKSSIAKLRGELSVEGAKSAARAEDSNSKK